MTACPLAHRVQIVFEEPRVCVIVQAMSKKAVTTRYTIRQPIQEQGGELSPCQGPFPRPYTAERCARNAALRNNTEEAMVKRKKRGGVGEKKKQRKSLETNPRLSDLVPNLYSPAAARSTVDDPKAMAANCEKSSE